MGAIMLRVGVTWCKPVLTNTISVNNIDGFSEFYREINMRKLLS